MPLARFSLWLFAIIAALIPLYVLASKPSFELRLLFDSQSYLHLRRDYAFTAIAILILAFVDIGETMNAVFASGHRIFFVLWPLMLSIVILLILFGIICGEADTSEQVSHEMVQMFYASLACAFTCRLLLIGVT